MMAPLKVSRPTTAAQPVNLFVELPKRTGNDCPPVVHIIIDRPPTG
ncbi:hypothetical protein SAMN05216268_10985 [Streptomyces yunnanensis]|uniref:Uncharacterized protein n=1 Tax=Streptomyces yunnanensis TaxID=156453 RepID=A0A9X8QUE7_9ACTN|nr:hypothetical protein SAMN05216268_10985 [Streptomyces yunnanensis]